MVDDTANQLALRAKAATLLVCTTGVMSLSATATGFARSDGGSFITNGFAPGMLATPAGFVDNTLAVIQDVQAAAITIDGTRTIESAAGGRSLSVGLPTPADENVAFAPIAGVPYSEENYVPGPTDLRTIGAFGRVIAEPMYVIKLYGLANAGVSGLTKVAGALLNLFAPETLIPIGNGDTLRVRAKPAPYRGQLLQLKTGFACVVVTIPLRLYTLNSI